VQCRYPQALRAIRLDMRVRLGHSGLLAILLQNIDFYEQ